jgi:hypothetical protein
VADLPQRLEAVDTERAGVRCMARATVVCCTPDVHCMLQHVYLPQRLDAVEEERGAAHAHAVERL